jgi:hypothetical protein
MSQSLSRLPFLSCPAVFQPLTPILESRISVSSLYSLFSSIRSSFVPRFEYKNPPQTPALTWNFRATGGAGVLPARPQAMRSTRSGITISVTTSIVHFGDKSRRRTPETRPAGRGRIRVESGANPRKFGVNLLPCYGGRFFTY